MSQDQMFYSLFENMIGGAAIFEVNNSGKTAKDYIIKGFNKAGLRLEGKTKEEVIGKSLYDLRFDMDHDKLVKIFHEVWKSGKPKYYLSKIYHDNFPDNGYENYVFKLPSGEIVSIHNDITKLIATQEILKQNRKIQSEYIKKAPYGVFISDEDGNILEVNDEGLQIIGEINNTLNNKNIYEFIDTDDKNKMSKTFQKIKKEGQGSIQINIKRKDNELRSLNVKVIKLNDHKYLGFAEDITIHQKAQADLALSEKRLNRAQQIAKVGNWEMKIEQDKLWASSEAFRIFGLIPDRLHITFEEVEQLIHEEDREKVRRTLFNMIENQVEYDINYRIIAKDTGMEKDINSKAVCEYDKNGEPKKILGVIRDITEYKKAQQDLIDRDMKFGAMISNISDVIGILDYTGRIQYSSPNSEKWFGLESKDLIDKNAFDVVHPDDYDYTKQELYDILKHPGLSKTIEFRLKCGDSHYKHVRLKAINLIHDKNINGVLVNYHDITDRIKLEKEKKIIEAALMQQQKLEAIGTLAGGVAHEINNPINGIINYSQLIIDDVDNKENVVNYSNEIIHESERIAHIVKNLLQFSRQEKQVHSFARVEDIVEQSISLLKTVIIQDQITLTVNIKKGLPQVKCRSQQIQQVIMNLLTNARDAVNEKYPEYDENKVIIVECKKHRVKKQQYLRITVKDHGNGIDDTLKDNIMNPFFSTKPKEKGTGLGLSISYGIIQDHNGKLSFDTKKNQYTKFFIDLPVTND